MAEHKLFIFNAVLIGCLVVGTFLFQQGNSNITPIVPASHNLQIENVVPVPTSSPSIGVSTRSASTIVVQKKATVVPFMRRHEYNDDE
jgi:hypothetical protein